MSVRTALSALAVAALTAACGGSAAETASVPVGPSPGTPAPSASAALTPSAAPSASSSASSEPQECGDFACGESCETDPEKYPDFCSESATRDEASYFAEGMWGLYGAPDFTYGAISACADFYAGAGDWTYDLVDGQTNSSLTLRVDYDTESDQAQFSFTRLGEQQPYATQLAEYQLESREQGVQRVRASLSGAEQVYLTVPTEATEGSDCADPVRP